MDPVKLHSLPRSTYRMRLEITMKKHYALLLAPICLVVAALSACRAQSNQGSPSELAAQDKQAPNSMAPVAIAADSARVAFHVTGMQKAASGAT